MQWAACSAILCLLLFHLFSSRVNRDRLFGQTTILCLCLLMQMISLRLTDLGTCYYCDCARVWTRRHSNHSKYKLEFPCHYASSTFLECIRAASVAAASYWTSLCNSMHLCKSSWYRIKLNDESWESEGTSFTCQFPCLGVIWYCWRLSRMVSQVLIILLVNQKRAFHVDNIQSTSNNLEKCDKAWTRKEFLFSIENLLLGWWCCGSVSQSVSQSQLETYSN